MPIATVISMYILIRLFSFLTYNNTLANSTIGGVIILAFGFVCLKNLKLGWLILVGELLIDGAGHFFEFNNLLLRTWFLGIFGLAWLVAKIRDRKLAFTLPRYIVISKVALMFSVLWSVINGFIFQNSTAYILQDAILYFFILLVFPAIEFASITKKTLIVLTKSWLFGTAFFSLVTYLIYSAGIGNLPDKYYHWFRNIASGKITDLGNHFFRVVLPEQLFVVPIILIIMAYLMRQPKNKKLWMLILGGVVIVTLNFSRIYWLGLIVGTIVLAFRNSLKRWLAISSLVLVSIPLLFSSLHFLSSRGQSFGLETLGLRVGGVTAMQTDTSGAIRLAILPDIFRRIRAHPWLGSGLGATVSYIDPVTQTTVIRNQYDWGYLEMITKLGILGTAIFFWFFFSVLYKIAKIAYTPTDSADETAMAQGLLAGGIALGVMNITTPALFQGFGILYIVFMLVVIQKKAHVS